MPIIAIQGAIAIGIIYLITSFILKIVRIGCKQKLELEKIRHGIPLDEDKPKVEHDDVKIIDYRSQGLN